MENILEKKQLCLDICKKDECPKNINQCSGTIHKKCVKKGVSLINCLNNDQIKYIMSDIGQDIFLRACPGSGKTEVLAIKSVYEINKWEETYKGMAILTFTNSAENEIKIRVGEYLNRNLSYPHFIGTFTSWIHGYIGNPFASFITKYKGEQDGDKSIRLIDNGIMSNFLNAYSTKYSYQELGYIKANEYYIDTIKNKCVYVGNKTKNGQEILDRLLSQDSWRYKELVKLKKRFWEGGFCTFEDIEYIVCIILKKYPQIAKYIAERFPIILIDECQDLSCVQLEILRLLNQKGANLHFIGDLNQSIYGFRRIYPEDTENFIKKLSFITLELKQNYRSCQKIVDVCNVVLSKENKIKGCREQLLESPLIVISYNKGKGKDVINKFDALIRANNLDCKNSKIIVRNNNMKNKLLGISRSKPYSSINTLETIAKGLYFCKNCNNINEYKEGFLLLCRALQRIYFSDEMHLNKSYYYAPINMEIQEWKVLVSKLKDILIKNEKLFEYEITWNKWKEYLLKELKEGATVFEQLRDKKMNLGRIRSGNSKKKIIEVLSLNNECSMNYEVTTVHSCKGLSLDAVLFLSSYKKPSSSESGGHWSQWFDTKIINEKNRMAYVGFSRAKYLLALGIPKTNSFKNRDRKRLMDYGFKIIDVD